MMVVRSTATATRGNQQLSLLEICDDSLFAQTKMRGGGDGRLSFARVPCPLLPFFLVILLPLLPLLPARVAACQPPLTCTLPHRLPSRRPLSYMERWRTSAGS